VSVSLPDTTVNPTKMDKLIEVLFGVWTRIGIWNRVLGGAIDPPGKEAIWELTPCDVAFHHNIL